MGARAGLVLNHPDRRQAETALQRVQEEIIRLERVFNLFDPNSYLSRLNRDGVLDLPPLDLVRCLSEADRISQMTDGAFDVTVQPLWNLYARHFASAPPGDAGPDKRKIAATRQLVDYRAVRNGPRQISFSKPGMAVTLNGIAQGYITDRVAELLNANGFDNVLINLGEARGLGHREDGSPWRVGIREPDGAGDLSRKIELRNSAVATSGGYGTRFSSDGKHHHLFDPKTGRSANLWASVSVIADDATRADALSTAFSGMPESSLRLIADDSNVSVVANDGNRVILINV